MYELEHRKWLQKYSSKCFEKGNWGKACLPHIVRMASYLACATSNSHQIAAISIKFHSSDLLQVRQVHEKTSPLHEMKTQWCKCLCINLALRKNSPTHIHVSFSAPCWKVLDKNLRTEQQAYWVNVSSRCDCIYPTNRRSHPQVKTFEGTIFTTTRNEPMKLAENENILVNFTANCTMCKFNIYMEILNLRYILLYQPSRNYIQCWRLSAKRGEKSSLQGKNETLKLLYRKNIAPH